MNNNIDNFLTKQSNSNVQSEINLIAKTAEEETGKKVSIICPLDQGGNNRLFKVSFKDDFSIMVKRFYLSDNCQDFPRAKTEYQAFKFFWDHGNHKVPQPIFINLPNQISAYQFVEGKILQPDQINENMVSQLTNFIRDLTLLSKTNHTQKIGAASDSCLSFSDYLHSIKKRFLRIQQELPEDKNYLPIKIFLDKKFKPVWEKVESKFMQQVSKMIFPITLNQKFEKKEMILSPSDFGFHNCLMQEDGQIIFLDFEYFGWDHQAKLIADFLFHPAMELSHQLKTQFVIQSLTELKASDLLVNRLKQVIAPVGLKWCLLILNFCCSRVLGRKKYANPSIKEEEFIFLQLQKAENKLKQVVRGEIYELLPSTTTI